MGNRIIQRVTGHTMARRMLAAFCAAVISIGSAAAAPVKQASAATPAWNTLSAKLKRSSYGFFIWRSEHGASKLDAARPLMPRTS